jgi:hypothetical protein
VPDPDRDLFSIVDGRVQPLVTQQFFQYANTPGERRSVTVTLQHDFTSIPDLGDPVTTRQDNSVFDLGPGQRHELRPRRYQYRHGHLGGERNRYVILSVVATTA